MTKRIDSVERVFEFPLAFREKLSLLESELGCIMQTRIARKKSKES
jgi:hypothetical protein